MSDTAMHPRRPLPRLLPMRIPADPWPFALASNAHQAWRITRHAQAAGVFDGKDGAAEGNPADEYRGVCEFMRLYATLRFYQLALLLGTTGSIISALSSQAVLASFARAELLKSGAFVVSLAFAVMEVRASARWHGLCRRANTLAERLGYEPFAMSSRFVPWSTSGASLGVHLFITAMWFVSLFVRLVPQPG